MADASDLERSLLGAMSFVGGFPALDSAGGLGDVTTTFTLDCL